MDVLALCGLDMRLYNRRIPYIAMDAFSHSFSYFSDLTFNVDQTRDSAKSNARFGSVRMEHIVLAMSSCVVCRNQYWMNDFSFLSNWLVVSSLKK